MSADVLSLPGAPPPIALHSLKELLANPDALRGPVPVIPHLAWTGRVTLLAAREKDGKSTLVAAGCAALSQGRRFLGEFVDAGNVLWLSSDAESPYDLVARFQRFGAFPTNVWLADEWDRVPASFLRAVLDNRPTVAVIDTLASFAELAVEDANASAAWTPVMTALKRCANESGTAIVLLHHASKATGRYRDSTAIGAGVDVLLEMEPVESDPTVRRLRARGRFRVADVSVRLDGNDFALDAGLPSLDARVLAAVAASPGISGNRLRGQGLGRTTDIQACLKRLEASGAIASQPGPRGANLWRPTSTPASPVPVVPSAREQVAEPVVPEPHSVGGSEQLSSVTSPPTDREQLEPDGWVTT